MLDERASALDDAAVAAKNEHGGKRTPGPGKHLGRPPSPDPLQVAQIRLRAETLAALAKLAQSRGATVSELVREIVEKYVARAR